VAPAASALELAAHGATDYRIAIPSDAGPAVKQAAVELSEFLGAASGASFAVVERNHVNNAKPWIRLSAGVPQPGSDNRQAYRLTVDGKVLAIHGNSPRALVYGVYRVLELQVGVHWFDALGGPTITRHERLRINVEPGWHAPRFHYREVFYRHSDLPAFAAHNRLNGRFGHRLQKPIPARYGGGLRLRQINIAQLVPRKEYAAAHPQFYGGGQLRFANPAMREVARRHLRALVKKWDDGPAYLLISHADRETYYHAGADAQLIQRYGAPSAAWVDFVRDLAGVVAEIHPRTTVLVQAYLWSRKPPQGMALPDNMGVMLAGIQRDFSQPMDAPANQPFLDDLKGWAKLTDHIVVWDYVTNFAGYIQPYPNLHNLGDNLRILARHDAVEGVFLQGAYSSRGGELARLRTWLLARLLWDPEQDPAALKREFVTGYFGPAAPFVLAYLEALKAAAKRWPGKLTAKTAAEAGYLDAEFLGRADQLFARAADAVAPDSRYARRVATARIPVDYAILVNGDRMAQDGSGKKRLQRLRENLAAAHVRAYREGSGGDIASLLQALKIQRDNASAPAVCAQIPAQQCLVAGDISLRLAGGGARLVADDEAADGGAAALPGDARAWGIQLPLADLLPATGDWRLYVIARTEGTGCLLQVGVYPGTQKTVVCRAQGGYQSLAIPGRYHGGDDGYVWIAPAHDPDVKRILVDRIVAIPAKGG
ncbi:MAG: DUF4838 domain-containing protein, partial [Salinisphaera sp.]|nr:DUF4838 domain-containing protein [Salinisphaera sp.]